MRRSDNIALKLPKLLASVPHALKICWRTLCTVLQFVRVLVTVYAKYNYNFLPYAPHTLRNYRIRKKFFNL
jgi:hypothetical protein